jgi:hypothetical protein
LTFTTLESGINKDASNRIGWESVMTQNERDEARREGLIRAVAVVQRYQNVNWRRLRVNDICADIKRLIEEEVARAAELSKAD